MMGVANIVLLDATEAGSVPVFQKEAIFHYTPSRMEVALIIESFV